MKYTKLTVTFLLLFSFFRLDLAAANESCSKASRQEFLSLNETLYQEYRDIDTQSTMTSNKKAFWIEGNPKVNKALFLAHGYMGSPGEMKYLAEPFIKAGWSIIGFLLPGHGSTHLVANVYKHPRWSNFLKTQLDLVSKCFKEVKAVGFSTGGLLLTQYALNEKKPSSLKSLHLISPYYIQRFGGFFDSIIGHFVNGLSVDTAYFLTRFKDLKVMTLDSQFYHQNLPIDAGLQVKELGIIESKKDYAAKKIPVQLFISEGDWTVDIQATKDFIIKNFEDVELTYYKGEEPHHLMSPSVSSKAKEIQQKIFNF